MSNNGIILQYFHWYIKNDGNLWKQLKKDAKYLKELGITAIYIPPCFKATSTDDVGYGIYDLYDLGEFDQKGSIRTKYGTKEELIDAINELHKENIQVYADIVLNHKAAADYTEKFNIVEVDPQDRNKQISDVYEIEAWTGFDFKGRNGKYSDFKWNFNSFTAVDYDVSQDRNGIFVIQGENGKGVIQENTSVSQEYGNFQYLMFADIDYSNPYVKEEVNNWLMWFIKQTNIDGVRLDAIKHINDWFIRDLIANVRTKLNKDFYAVGEYWIYDYEQIKDYLETTNYNIDLFDVALHYNFYTASKEYERYDLRNIFDNTLVKNNPTLAVTFTDNHDTQKDQSLESRLKPWFRPIAYSLILLRNEGYPCVFYGDLQNYDVDGNWLENILKKLIYLRKTKSYQNQTDYFDNPNILSWVRYDEDNQNAMVVVITNSEDSSIDINLGDNYKDKKFYDYLGHNDTIVEIDENGNANFPVSARSVSVYIIQ